MKGKITITIDDETMIWLEMKAKERNITVIQLAEEISEKGIKRLIAKEEHKELL